MGRNGRYRGVLSPAAKKSPARFFGNPMLFAALCLIVASATAVATTGLESYEERHRSLRDGMQTIQTAVAEQSQIEWQAIAEGGLSTELEGRLATVRLRTTDAARRVGELGGTGKQSDLLSTLAEYMDATGEEFRLLRLGDIEAAEVVDEERVDPSFERLREIVSDEAAVAGQQAGKALTVLKLGIYGVLLLGGLMTGILFWRFDRARRSARQAVYDPLTGLANRMLLFERLATALGEADRDGTRVAVMFIDVDDFKRINDTRGHAVGDAVVVAVAERVSSIARESDTVARLGGDEFALIFDDVASAEAAEAAAKRVITLFEDPIAVDGHTLRVRVTVGCAISEPGKSRPDDLLRNADLAMYAGKHDGKNRAALYDPSMFEALADRVALEENLRDAVARGEISVAYQPIVGVSDGEVRGFEALARWNHPERGVVPPLTFIPIAEETGQIGAIGAFILREACRQLAVWHATDTRVPPLGISVNVSPVQLDDDDIFQDVVDAICDAKIPAGSLTLEITESVLIERGDAFLDRLRGLREIGVRIAMDDFGTGYSSLSSLTRLPVDVLKIDRGFVEDIDGHDAGATLVRSVIDLGLQLGLETVAEGIESEAQRQRLDELGCDFGQGFLFARPLEQSAASEFIDRDRERVAYETTLADRS